MFQVKVFYVHGPDASRRDVDEMVRTFVRRAFRSRARALHASTYVAHAFVQLAPTVFPFSGRGGQTVSREAHKGR